MSAICRNAASAALVEPRYQPLVLVLLAASAGIVVDRFTPLPILWWLGAAGAAILLWLVGWCFGRSRLSAALILLGATCIGGAWHHLYWREFAADEIGSRAFEEARPACVEVVVLSPPRWTPAPSASPLRSIPKGDESRLVVQVVAVRDGESWRPASGRTALDVEGHLLGVQAGDRLQVFGFLGAPRPPQNPGEFDYAAYLRTERILALLHADSPECVTLISRGSWWNWRRILGVLRTRCDELLWKHVNHSRAGLASAILLGAREQLDKEATQDFFVTGTVHILAISGMNVGILVYGFWWATRAGLLSRRKMLLAASAFVLVYMLLTDSQPPVMRATILVIVICFARWFGRRALAFNSLAAGGLVILALNPAQLFQIGTQLSFLAVATLSCCERWLAPRSVIDPLDRLIEQSRSAAERWLRRFAGSVWRLTLTGAVIWLVVLPLVWQQFCLISPVAVPLSPVLALPIALALYAGFAVLVLGWLAPPLADGCGWVCDASLAFVEGSIHLAKHVPANHFWQPSPAWWWTAGFYAALGLAVAYPRIVPPKRWCVAIFLAWSALGLATSSRIPERLAGGKDGLACTFVSVGHGTSAIIELPDGKTLLYDAGRMGSHVAGARAIAATLWSRRISHLDAVVVSHADADHYNALPDLLEQFSVGVIYVTPSMFDNDQAPGVVELKRRIEASGVPLAHLAAGESLKVSGGARVTVLHPEPGFSCLETSSRPASTMCSPNRRSTATW
jgi:competence protein ComEC